MSLHIRLAQPSDLDQIVHLLTLEAKARQRIDRHLWRPVPNTQAAIAPAFLADCVPASVRRWIIASSHDQIIGVIRFGVVPCPPIYHLAGQPAFITFDEFYLTDPSSDAVAGQMIEAAEREGRAMGAVIFLAAAGAAQRDRLRHLNAASYETVTHYLVKHDLHARDTADSVRKAQSGDVAAIVDMGAQSQRALCMANERMWTPHPEARSRFALWMNYSLTLADRQVFVRNDSQGFIIAQPLSDFHLPLSCERKHVGVVDDFWSDPFDPAGGPLLSAAEDWFANHHQSSAMVICPQAWPAKRDFSRARGYSEGNCWLLKR